MSSPEGPQLLAKFEPYIAIGFAIVNPPGTIRNPYHLMHGKHYRYVPSLSLPGPFAFIHTAHVHSDTIAAQRGKLARARADHALYFGDRPRRFKQAIAQQFDGKNASHFLTIIRHAPSQREARRRERAMLEQAPAEKANAV